MSAFFFVYLMSVGCLPFCSSKWLWRSSLHVVVRQCAKNLVLCTPFSYATTLEKERPGWCSRDIKEPCHIHLPLSLTLAGANGGSNWWWCYVNTTPAVLAQVGIVCLFLAVQSWIASLYWIASINILHGTQWLGGIFKQPVVLIDGIKKQVSLN